MYTRATIVQVGTGKLDEAVTIYRDSVVPAARQQAGFHDAILLDWNTGKGISLTFWKTEAEMEAGEGSGYYQQQLGKFKDIFTAVPIRDQYEVAVQALAAEAGS